jgi:predicted AlkP superfamily phosphohydrolase/phosphomutase
MSSSDHRRKVLAVSLDAASATHALQWASEGKLPTLGRLMQEGATARLRSIADHFPDAIWPTINTGCLPGKHGHYNFRCFRPGTYSMTLAPDRSYRRPFWELMRRNPDGGEPLRLIVFDVQRSSLLAEDGVTQVIGWGQRAAQRFESWPPELLDDLVERYGRPPRWLDDDVVRRSARAEGRYLRTVLRMAAARSALLRDLLRERAWDFCLASYHETHNGGHVFFRYLEPGTWAYDERRATRFGGALLQIYQAVDRGLGELLGSVPDGTDVVVFAGQSLRLNTNGLFLLPRVLIALGYQVPADAPLLTRALNAAATHVPWSIRRHLNRRLSPEAGRRALERMWREATDWPRTRAVAETAYGQSWVRVNLRGREPQGTVKPGPEYDALCEEISAELRALVAADSGEPVVAEVLPLASLIEGPCVGEMPDLLVRWTDDRLVRAVRHPRTGVIRESMHDFVATEHGADAFLVAAGPRIRRGATGDGGHIVDIAPTLLHLMGCRIPEDMDGNVLTSLLEPDELARRPVRQEPMDWSDDPWGADAAGPTASAGCSG